jgi:sulfate/thiosulfate-binding protein
MKLNTFFRGLLIAPLLLSSLALQAADKTLLNVSYDPTRELYVEYNKLFTKHWKDTTGENVVIKQSHGGGGKQVRAVIDGLEGDVVTQALSYDVDQLYEKAKLIPQDWQTRLPNNSSPYTSTIVFLVRKGNPQNIRDWNDIVKPGISVVSPNPKTSGGARYNYLAAWGYALKHNNNDEAVAKDFVKKLYKNVSVLDSGARGATTTFLERGIGDVLLTWENEAFLALREYGSDNIEIVVPPLSILAEPPVTVVDKFAKKHGNEALAKAYLEYLYSPEAQDIIGKNFYRPTQAAAVEKYAKQFPKLELFTIQEVFGGWQAAQKKHFSDGGVFDEIYAPGN